MKSASAICLALVVGFVLGTVSHTVPARAQGPVTVYIDQTVASGLKVAHTISGAQIVGFSCGPGTPGPGSDCYVLSTK
jgi:hypothetical protein